MTIIDLTTTDSFAKKQIIGMIVEATIYKDDHNWRMVHSYVP